MQVNGGMSSQMQMQQMGQGPKHNQQPLSDTQKTQVNDILSNYDANNLSEDDFQAISEQFKESGIPTGPGLKSVVEEAGFDFSEYAGQGRGELGEQMQTQAQARTMQGQGNGQHQGNGNGPKHEMQQSYANDLAQLLESDEVDQSAYEALLEQIQQEQGRLSGAILNQTA